MLKFSDKTLWRIKDFFWWVRIYRLRIFLILLPFLSSNLIIFFASLPAAEERKSGEKFNKCVSFVYQLMQENEWLEARALQYKEEIANQRNVFNMCNEKLDELLSNPNYRE